METLQELRTQIDQIDRDIARLFEARMNVIKKVSQVKIASGMETVDPAREKAMLNKNRMHIVDPNIRIYYDEVLQVFLKVSKDLQESLKH